MTDRDLVLKKWKDLKETVLSWKEAYEEHVKEQNEEICRWSGTLKEQKNELVKIKTKLEKQLQVIDREQAEFAKITAQDVIGWSIKEIIYLLPFHFDNNNTQSLPSEQTSSTPSGCPECGNPDCSIHEWID